MWEKPFGRPRGEAATSTAVVTLATDAQGEPEGLSRRRPLRGLQNRRGDWHHPKVFRSTQQHQWRWECRCGASSSFAHLHGQRAAAIAALVHVGSQGVAR
jgi:hypothetical protein